MGHRKRRAFIQRATNTPTHSLSIKYIPIKSKLLFNIRVQDSYGLYGFSGLNSYAKKNVYDKNDFQRSHFEVPIHSFPLLPRQLTEYSKLPLKVVCKLSEGI